MTDEIRMKISEAGKKRFSSEEARKKQSEATTLWWAKRKGEKS